MANLKGNHLQGFGPEFGVARLDAADFDGTMYATFENDPARGVYGVDEAYRASIEEVFVFDKDALAKYIDQGEHNNRTPLEIVSSLAPNATPGGLELLTERLVEAKLKILEGQIGKIMEDGTPWPRPMPGFEEYSRTVTDFNKAGGSRIDRAVLSAGHASFIRKCLRLYGLEQPDIMVTDETIRGLNSRMPPDRMAKPAVMPLAIAKLQWLAMYDLLETTGDHNAINHRITVIGDSSEKDGGLAQNAEVAFIHVTPETSLEAWRSITPVRDIGRHAVTGSRI